MKKENLKKVNSSPSTHFAHKEKIEDGRKSQKCQIVEGQKIEDFNQKYCFKTANSFQV